MENARLPCVLDFMAGMHNSERDDDRSQDFIRDKKSLKLILAVNPPLVNP